jgi:hypothetical protein
MRVIPMATPYAVHPATIKKSKLISGLQMLCSGAHLELNRWKGSSVVGMTVRERDSWMVIEGGYYEDAC